MQKPTMSATGYLSCVILGCIVKSTTSLLNRMSRLKAHPSHVLIASDALWTMSYLILLCSELAACAYERRARPKEKRQTLDRAEMAQCLIIAVVYTIM